MTTDVENIKSNTPRTDQKCEVIPKEELFDRLRSAVSHLPIDKFVTVDSDGAYFVDWERIAVDDFKDSAKEFAKAMRQVKCVQMTEGYYD